VPTTTKENYLKAIYHLQNAEGKISISDLGKELEVSKPTIHDMVKKLQKKGWVSYEKYKPIELTTAGKKMATAVIRKHRLAEMFLTEIMGFGWEEVHDIAEELEHLKSETFFDRMDELLGFPTTDPHGSVIPDKNGKVVSKSYPLLSEIPVGEEVQLMALAESSVEFLNFLTKKGIKLNSMMTVEDVEPFDRSINIKLSGQNQQIQLSSHVCNRLKVKRHQEK
jgi:DtxR family Mn-dependent transcriptional regulator